VAGDRLCKKLFKSSNCFAAYFYVVYTLRRNGVCFGGEENADFNFFTLAQDKSTSKLGPANGTSDVRARRQENLYKESGKYALGCVQRRLAAAKFEARRRKPHGWCNTSQEPKNLEPSGPRGNLKAEAESARSRNHIVAQRNKKNLIESNRYPKPQRERPEVFSPHPHAPGRRTSKSIVNAEHLGQDYKSERPPRSEAEEPADYTAAYLMIHSQHEKTFER